jgi:hypothetical protein
MTTRAQDMETLTQNQSVSYGPMKTWRRLFLEGQCSGLHGLDVQALE